jgi:hypothetical protein
MATQMDAIQVKATLSQSPMQIEPDALISALLRMMCGRQGCSGKFHLQAITHHGQQHKFELLCGVCRRKFIFQTHRETGLVRVRLPTVVGEKELSLQRVVATILVLMTGHSQKTLTYFTHSQDGGFTRTTADRYMQLLCPAVVEAAKASLKATRVEFKHRIGPNGKYSASFDCGWRTRGAHAYGGSGDIISMPRKADERPVRLASAVLQRPHLIRVTLADGSKKEVIIGADNHEGTSRGMEGQAFNLCLDDLKVLFSPSLHSLPRRLMIYWPQWKH